MSLSPVSRKAIGLLILVFVLGIAFGSLGTIVFNSRVYGGNLRRSSQPQPPAVTARAVARINQDLSLSADQQKQLTDILNGMQSGYNVIRQQMTPEFDKVREQGRNQIRQILTPDQRPKFEDYLQRLDEDRRKRAAAAATNR